MSYVQHGSLHGFLEREFSRLDYRLAISRRPHGFGTAFYASSIDDTGHIVWEEGPENMTAPILLQAEPEVWELIAALAADVAPPTPATVRHLEDAIKVRDRLLTLVEHSHGE